MMESIDIDKKRKIETDLQKKREYGRIAAIKHRQKRKKERSDMQEIVLKLKKGVTVETELLLNVPTGTQKVIPPSLNEENTVLESSVVLVSLESELSIPEQNTKEIGGMIQPHLQGKIVDGRYEKQFASIGDIEMADESVEELKMKFCSSPAI
eukprot:TRINITY_DN3879_c0_g1_i3.p1 TRINITY_DN3879_c0_g1~~TRINITY_DN3879_c0_g1_i3.p1  ORF type:complete len:153 (+),score=37.68 TRINITY_DN3879_c0_g1_i3:220-678(+)